MRAPILTTLLFVLATASAPFPVADHRPGLDSGLPTARLLSKEPTKNIKGGATQPTKKQTQTPKTSQNSKSTPQKKTDQAPSQKSTQPNLSISKEALLNDNIKTLAWDVEKTWSPEALKCIQSIKAWFAFSPLAYLPAYLEPGYPKIKVVEYYPRGDDLRPFCSITLTFKKGLSCDLSNMPANLAYMQGADLSLNDPECLPYITLATLEYKHDYLEQGFSHFIHTLGRTTCRPETSAIINAQIEKIAATGIFIPEFKLSRENILAVFRILEGGYLNPNILFKHNGAVCSVSLYCEMDKNLQIFLRNQTPNYEKKAANSEDSPTNDPCESLMAPGFVLKEEKCVSNTGLAGKAWREAILAPFVKAMASDTVFMKPNVDWKTLRFSYLIEDCFPSHSNFELVIGNPSGTCPVGFRQDSDKQVHITHTAETNGCQSFIRPERLLNYFAMPR